MTGDSQGAGDQGPDVRLRDHRHPRPMPLPIALAHRLSRRLTEVPQRAACWTTCGGRQDTGYGQLPGNTPVRLTTQWCCPLQRMKSGSASTARWRRISARSSLGARGTRAGLWTSDYRLLVNPTGKFVLGGWATGLMTGRKDHRRHLRRLGSTRGGAFSARIRQG